MFRIVSIMRKLVYFVALLCFVALAVNGFYPSVVLGKPISGYYLILQVTAGGVFAGCLAVLAVMWAHRCRFDKSDWQRLQRLIRREASESSDLGQKICFWLIVLLALPVILSIVLSMFPLFGTDGQKFLLQLHRYSALLLALVVIVHTYLIIRTQC